MRLTCPRCGAQYEIPDSAIPAAGREVECSACSEVWHQPGMDLTAPASETAATAPSGADYDPLARPELNQPLHESILSILREETARELTARKSPLLGGGDPEAGGPDHIDATVPPATRLPDPRAIDWPVATVILPGEPLPPPTPDPAAADVRAAVPADVPAAEPPLPDAARLAATLLRHAPAPDDPRDEDAAKPPVGAAAMLSRPAPAEQAAPAPVVRPLAEGRAVALVSPQATLPDVVKRRTRGAYATGFGLAVMVALALLAFYALAPRFSTPGDGSFIAQSRADLDRGRAWLSDRAEAVWTGLTGEP